jgi:hypothetical protein
MSKCPECGVDLAGMDPVKHAISHWGERVPDPQKYPEAAKRYNALIQLKGVK